MHLIFICFLEIHDKFNIHLILRQRLQEKFKKMRNFFIYGLTLVLLVQLYVAPPVGKEEKQQKEDFMYNTEGLTKEQAQDQEYFRYLTQVVGQLEKDEEFKKILNNASEEDIRSGKLAEHLDLVGNGVRYEYHQAKLCQSQQQKH